MSHPEFGVIITCTRDDLFWAAGTAASVRHFMGDTPICLIADGDFDTRSVCRAVGASVIYPRDVRSDVLRARSFGWGYTKMIAFWESPFERFLTLDADTLVWGDVRAHLYPLDWDVVTDSLRKPLSDRAVASEFATTRRFREILGDYDVERYRRRLFCAGVLAGRRGAFELQDYLDLLDWQKGRPGIRGGDQTLTNMLVFLGENRGTLRVRRAPFQALSSDYGPTEYAKRFGLLARTLPDKRDNPVVLHYTSPKPTILSGPVARPMTLFRLRVLKQEGLGTPRAWLRILADEWRFHSRVWKMRFDIVLARVTRPLRG